MGMHSHLPCDAFMALNRLAFKTTAVVLAIMMFATNALLAHTPEVNFWKERARTPSLPFHPAAVSSTDPTGFVSLRIKRLSAAADKTLLPIINSIPPTAGTVRNVISPKGKAKGIVVHIQDVHRNAEAQLNIGRAVQGLIDARLAGHVALEGAFEPIDFSWFRSYPNQRAVKAVADYLFREYRISGPVRAAFLSASPLPAFIGIDDKVHYEANVAAVRESFALAEKYKEKHTKRVRLLEDAKSRFFNAELMGFDARIESYRNGGSSWGDYVRLIAAHETTLSSNTGMFLTALEMERRLDFTLVESQRAALIARLTRLLGKAGMRELLAYSAAYKAGAMAPSDFYSALRDFCGSADINLRDYPAMEQYIRYVLFSENLDVSAILAETSAAEREIYERLARTSQERSIVEESRRSYLEKKLLDFSLTSQEWAEYKASVAGVSPFEEFYRRAEARDEAMARNVLKFNPKTVVLVTGGFHSEGVDRRLTEQGYSVVTFVPKVTKLEHNGGASYLSVFAQEQTPLDRLFKGEKLFLAESPMPAIQPVKNLIEAVNTALRERVDSGQMLDDKGVTADVDVQAGILKRIRTHSTNAHGVLSALFGFLMIIPFIFFLPFYLAYAFFNAIWDLIKGDDAVVIGDNATANLLSDKILRGVLEEIRGAHSILDYYRDLFKQGKHVVRLKQNGGLAEALHRGLAITLSKLAEENADDFGPNHFFIALPFSPLEKPQMEAFIKGDPVTPEFMRDLMALVGDFPQGMETSDLQDYFGQMQSYARFIYVGSYTKAQDRLEVELDDQIRPLTQAIKDRRNRVFVLTPAPQSPDYLQPPFLHFILEAGHTRTATVLMESVSDYSYHDPAHPLHQVNELSPISRSFGIDLAEAETLGELELPQWPGQRLKDLCDGYVFYVTDEEDPDSPDAPTPEKSPFSILDLFSFSRSFIKVAIFIFLFMRPVAFAQQQLPVVPAAPFAQKENPIPAKNETMPAKWEEVMHFAHQFDENNVVIPAGIRDGHEEPRTEETEKNKDPKNAASAGEHDLSVLKELSAHLARAGGNPDFKEVMAIISNAIVTLDKFSTNLGIQNGESVFGPFVVSFLRDERFSSGERSLLFQGSAARMNLQSLCVTLAVPKVPSEVRVMVMIELRTRHAQALAAEPAYLVNIRRLEPRNDEEEEMKRLLLEEVDRHTPSVNRWGLFGGVGAALFIVFYLRPKNWLRRNRTAARVFDDIADRETSISLDLNNAVSAKGLGGEPPRKGPGETMRFINPYMRRRFAAQA